VIEARNKPEKNDLDVPFFFCAFFAQHAFSSEIVVGLEELV